MNEGASLVRRMSLNGREDVDGRRGAKRRASGGEGVL